MNFLMFFRVKVLNTIKAKFMGGLEMTQLGRDYFDTNNPIDVPRFNLQVLNGYKTSTRQHENDVLLNVEVAHKVIRTDTVNDQIK